MYKIFYGMKESPFDNTIDPKVFFSSPNHNQAWNFILEELNFNETYILVVGEYGIGKTLMCNRLIDHLKKEENVSLVVIPSPEHSYRSILKLILEKIDPSFEFESVEDAQDRILSYITNKHDSRSIIVLLDDAQDMDLANTLPRFLSLGEIDVSDKPCLKLVMFGHINFLELLAYPNMETYNQRIRKWHTITPLDLTQTGEYIYYRLARAGTPGIPKFDDESIVLIYEYSRGIPRFINNVCDMALTIGADTKSLVIDSNIVTEAISVLSPIQNPLADKESGNIHEMSKDDKEEQLVVLSSSSNKSQTNYDNSKYRFIKEKMKRARSKILFDQTKRDGQGTEPLLSPQIISSFETLWSNILVEISSTPLLMLFNGAKRGEGVSFVSYHFALYLATEHSLKTVYIDLDLDSKLHPVLKDKLYKLPGISNFFSDGHPIEDLLVRTEYEDLFLLPYGHGNNGPKLSKILFNKNRFKDFIDYIRENFDVAIIDSPPVILHPEVSVIGKETDSVILVCRYRFSQYEVSQLAVEKLVKAGVKKVLAVLNDRYFPIPDIIYRRLK